MYTRNIILTGYWPPTNVMLKQFSRNRRQNEGNYLGENWKGLGYNIFAFFPDFEEDAVFEYDRNGPVYPVGSGDFKVDYQSTFRDFNRITEYYKPCAIITFSRLVDYDYIRIEPSHIVHAEWLADRYAPHQPAGDRHFNPTFYAGLGNIDDYYSSTLPKEKIYETASNDPNLNDVRIELYNTIDPWDNFLSHFIGLLGTKYQSDHNYAATGYQCRAAGHVHIGGNVAVDKAKVFSEIALQETIKHIDKFLNSTWIGTFAIRLAQNDAIDAGTTDPIVARVFRDDTLVDEITLDWGNRGDFLEPENEHLHVFSYGNLKRDPESTVIATPESGVEFSKGIHGHLRIELENTGNDLWRADFFELMVKEVKQKQTSDGRTVWMRDANFTTVYNNRSRIELVADHDDFDAKTEYMV